VTSLALRHATDEFEPARTELEATGIAARLLNYSVPTTQIKEVQWAQKNVVRG
jgi:hypothetical protein